MRLEAPTEAAVAALCAEGWSVTQVEPNIAPVNITLAGYFRQVLLRGTNGRAPWFAERARTEHARRAPELAEAQARMKPQSPRKPSSGST